MVETMEMNDVPEDFIFNWDQIDIYLLPGAFGTMDKKDRSGLKLLDFRIKGRQLQLCVGNFTMSPRDLFSPQLGHYS